MSESEHTPSAASLAALFRSALAAHVADPDAGAREARREREQIYQRREDRLEAAQVPGDRNIRRWALAAERPAGVAIKQTMALLGRREPREGMVVALIGPHGAGKTVALARAAAEWNGTARFVRAANLSRLLTPERKSFRADAEGEALRAEVERASLLLIDELGDDGDAQCVVDLLVERIDDGRVTLCASNLAMEAWHARYVTPRLGSRASSALHLVEVAAPDRRATGPNGTPHGG
jgi:DNA replication protein DnaC